MRIPSAVRPNAGWRVRRKARSATLLLVTTLILGLKTRGGGGGGGGGGDVKALERGRVEAATLHTSV